ncbi:MAG: N(4)-(beta-N-acetylglucosaminyl)-L-asparaginase [Erysipelotrichaceae bacterium]|nr:N(4)-(beta-N-acetylglucosaminyl)-L-asparaginase [Erysipelotrichaceae bacterium]
MKYCFVSTWEFSYNGSIRAVEALTSGKGLDEAIIKAITTVEDDENVHSVGYGGWPNKQGEVYLDAAFMNGSTMRYGAISSVKDIKNPIKVAHSLMKRTLNCFLTADGAEAYARQAGFEFRPMLTEAAKKKWESKSAETGHDTVCFIGKQHDDIMVGVSTSGLFMKEQGRVGDSPIIGSGYYADSEAGACAATGIGENIMRGCLSFNVVAYMRQGLAVQKACTRALNEHCERLKKNEITTEDISIIAIDKDGNLGVATTKNEFPFVYANDEKKPTLMVAYHRHNQIHIESAGPDWLATHQPS